MDKKTSQISGFYRKTLEERQDILNQWTEQNTPNNFWGNPLSLEQGDMMIENVVGLHSMPIGIATNFLVNGNDKLIPMVIEEPSVIAAISSSAKLFRQGGGFQTSSDPPIMIGQIQVLDIPNIENAIEKLKKEEKNLLEKANEVSGSIRKRGGGAKQLEVRVFTQTPVGPMLIVHLLYDTQDAMGANAINTALEHITEDIESITDGRVNLRILSNFADRRKARAEGMIPYDALATATMSGDEVVNTILEAATFASIDPYRAVTHNKGIMNGIDAVAIATGNDWRAIEAAAHAYAVRDGHYTSMTHWWRDTEGNLRGSLELPMAVGIVGGATRVHPMAQLALKILGVSSAMELAEIIVAVGLAQNLAAIRALATEGIQLGHMRMHARQLATAAGAMPAQVPDIAATMIAENKIRLERAKQLVEQLEETDNHD